MTPAEYQEAMRAFIRGNAGLFEDGNIFDPGPEPENGVHWEATWGPRWSWDPPYPNDATRAFNVFVRESQLLARALLREIGQPEVITAVRSVNSWWATRPTALEHETVAVIGALTLDSYPDGETSDPVEAVRLRVAEAEQVWQLWGRPVILGELGYPLKATVPDAVQRAVIAGTLEGLARLPFVLGVNYWVGAPSTDPRDFRTAVFEGRRGAWQPKPAALALARFYASPPRRPDGALALPPWRYGVNQVTDSGFERGESWRIDSAYQRELAAAAAGRSGLRVPGQGTWANASQEVALLPDRCYAVTVRARGPGSARLDVLDLDWKPLASTILRGGADWRTRTLPFSSRAQRNVIIAIRDSEQQGVLDLDDLEVRGCPGPAFE